MTDIKKVLNLLFTPWKPGIHLNFITLCNGLSEEDKAEHLDSIYILAICFKTPGIQMVAFNSLYDKYEMNREDSLYLVPPKVLINFWKHLTSYVLLHPQIVLLLHHLTPLLNFDDSYKIFPYLITLENPYLIHQFIEEQSFESIIMTLKYLFSSENYDLISSVFPMFLKREPNLISFAIYPDFNETVLTASLASSYTGAISKSNLAYLVLYLKNGKIKQDSQLFKALCYYIKKNYIQNITIDESLTAESLFEIINEEMPDLVESKAFSDYAYQTIQYAKSIIDNHQTDKIESFVQELIGDGNCDDFNRSIAAATISALIVTYSLDKNMLIKLILLLKQIKQVEFPDFLVNKLLRTAPNQIEKISSFHAIPAIVHVFLTGKMNDHIEELCSSEPYQILKALYILATFDQERKKHYDFPPEFLAFVKTVDFNDMKIPKRAPDYIKKFKYDGNAESLVLFYSNAFNDHTLIGQYFEVEKDFLPRLQKIAKKSYPNFSYEGANERASNFPHSSDEQRSVDDILFMTCAGNLALPDSIEESFNNTLSRSGYNNPQLTSTINSVYNDKEYDEYANLLMSTFGGM